MPSRIIREGWIESEHINELDAASERFFLHLCLRADDFGRYHANPTLLKSNLFPLREDIRITDIPRWLAACEKAGLLRCYEVDAKRYIEIHKFEQRTRARNSKFPAPPANDGHMPDMCQTLPDTCRTDDGHPRAETDSESDADIGCGVGVESGPAPDGALIPVESSFPPPLNTDTFKAAWTEWLAYRAERKLSSYKPRALAAQLKALSEWGHDAAIESIQASIRNQWQGLFSPKSSSWRSAQGLAPQFKNAF